MVGRPKAQYGRGSRYEDVGCVMVVFACPRSDAMDRGGDRAAVLGQTDSWQRAGKLEQTGERLTNRQEGEDDCLSTAVGRAGKRARSDEVTEVESRLMRLEAGR